MSVLVIDKTADGVLGARLSGLGVNVLVANSPNELTEMLESAKSFRAVVVFRMSRAAPFEDLLPALTPTARKSLSVFVVGGEDGRSNQADCAVHTFGEPLELDTFSKLLMRSVGPGER